MTLEYWPETQQSGSATPTQAEIKLIGVASSLIINDRAAIVFAPNHDGVVRAFEEMRIPCDPSHCKPAEMILRYPGK